MPLSKEEIIAAIHTRRRDVVTVQVPEWDGEVGIRRLDAVDLERTGMMSGVQPDDVAIKVLAASLCDADGEPLFGEADVRELEKADAVVVLKLFAECARVNGLMSSELEGMMATFAEAQPDDSPSS
jgi:hypothetical protein